MVIFLNDNIDEVYALPSAQKGMLRLYPNGEPNGEYGMIKYPNNEKANGVVDISPRLGRAVLFKSEEMYH